MHNRKSLSMMILLCIIIVFGVYVSRSNMNNSYEQSIVLLLRSIASIIPSILTLVRQCIFSLALSYDSTLVSFKLTSAVCMVCLGDDSGLEWSISYDNNSVCLVFVYPVVWYPGIMHIRRKIQIPICIIWWLIQLCILGASNIRNCITIQHIGILASITRICSSNMHKCILRVLVLTYGGQRKMYTWLFW